MHKQNLVKFYLLDLKMLSKNENLISIKGHNSVTSFQNNDRYNPNLDLVNINAQTEFSQILSVSSQDIKQK